MGDTITWNMGFGLIDHEAFDCHALSTIDIKHEAIDMIAWDPSIRDLPGDIFCLRSQDYDHMHMQMPDLPQPSQFITTF